MANVYNLRIGANSLYHLQVERTMSQSCAVLMLSYFTDHLTKFVGDEPTARRHCLRHRPRSSASWSFFKFVFIASWSRHQGPKQVAKSPQCFINMAVSFPEYFVFQFAIQKFKD